MIDTRVYLYDGEGFASVVRKLCVIDDGIVLTGGFLVVEYIDNCISYFLRPLGLRFLRLLTTRNFCFFFPMLYVRNDSGCCVDFSTVSLPTTGTLEFVSAVTSPLHEGVSQVLSYAFSWSVPEGKVITPDGAVLTAQTRPASLTALSAFGAVLYNDLLVSTVALSSSKWLKVLAGKISLMAGRPSKLE